MKRDQLIRGAEQVIDRALDQAAIAAAVVRFAQSGEVDLAQRANRILQSELKGQHRGRVAIHGKAFRRN